MRGVAARLRRALVAQTQTDPTTSLGHYFFFSPPSGDAYAERPNLDEGRAIGSGVYVTSSERSTSCHVVVTALVDRVPKPLYSVNSSHRPCTQPHQVGSGRPFECVLISRRAPQWDRLVI
jgi:hypothetical protein